MRRTIMNTTIPTIFVATLMMLALTTTTANAQQGLGNGAGPWWAEDGASNNPCPVEQLDLSVEQQEALDELRLEHFDNVAQLRDELVQARDLLAALADSEDVTTAEVEALELQMDDIHSALRSERRAYRGLVVDLLTVEQQSELPNGWHLGIDGNRGRHGHRHGHGQGFGFAQSSDGERPCGR